MKKIIVIFLVLIFAAFIGVVIYIGTMDTDRLRPVLQEQLRKATGMPVSMGKLSLSWQKGFSLRVNDVIVESADGSGSQLEIKGVSGLLEWMPLFNREIKVASIAIDGPHLKLSQAANGRILGLASEAAPPSGAASDSTVSSVPDTAGAAMAWLVNVIDVDGGSLSLVSGADQSKTNTLLDHLGLKISHVSLGTPMTLEGRARLMSAGENLTFNGKLTVDPRDMSYNLSHTKINLDLGQVELANVSSLIPGVTQQLPLASMDGRVAAEISSLNVDSSGKIRDLHATAAVQNGKAVVRSLDAEIREINADARVHPGLIEVERISGKIYGAEFSGTLTVENWMDRPELIFRGGLTGLDFDKIPQSGSDKDPRLSGMGSVTLSGESRKQSGVDLLATLSASGHASMEKGVIRNLNILREIFNKLSIIPNLVQKLQERLPPEYREKLNDRDTVLFPIKIPFEYKNGIAAFPDIRIASDLFEMAGSGTVTDTGKVFTQLTLRIDPHLSAAAAASIRELMYLADTDGRIAIPVKVQGTLPDIKVLPDLQFVAKKLAVSKAQEVISDMFKKPEPTASAGTTPTADPASVPKKNEKPAQGLLEQLLETAIQMQTPPASGTQNG